AMKVIGAGSGAASEAPDDLSGTKAQCRPESGDGLAAGQTSADADSAAQAAKARSLAMLLRVLGAAAFVLCGVTVCLDRIYGVDKASDHILPSVKVAAVTLGALLVRISARFLTKRRGGVCILAAST